MQRYHRDEYDDMDEYEEEYEDEEEEGSGDERYEKEEPAQPTQEELDYLELRKKIKESIRKKREKESGSSLTNSEQRKKKLPYENFGSFFGPSQPVISQRVIQESKSLLENPHLVTKVIKSEHDRNRRPPSAAQSKTQTQQQRRPNGVNELRTKVQKLKDTRDYSFLLSDDSKVPAPTINQPSRTASASYSEPRATGNLPVKSKQSVSNTGRQLQNGHQDKRPIMTSNQKRPKPVVEKSSSTSKVPRASVDPRRQLGNSNGSGPGQPQGGRDLAPRVTASSADRRTLPTGSKSSMPSSHRPPPPRTQPPPPKKPSVVKQPLNGRKEHMESSRGKIPPKQPLSSSKPQMKRAPTNDAARPTVRVDRPKKKPSRQYSDGEEDDQEAFAMLRKMLKYDPNKFDDDGDVSDMETNFDEIQREEKKSYRIAKMEDEEELRKIEEEERRERQRKKEAKKRKLSQR